MAPWSAPSVSAKSNDPEQTVQLTEELNQYEVSTTSPVADMDPLPCF